MSYYMQWEEQYALGIKAIDEQHKKLFVMINELFDALRESRGNEVVGEIIKGFLDYTAEHFALEEEYMQKCAYPAYDEHKQVHDDCVVKINDLLKMHISGKVHLSIVTFNFMKDWLINHVLGMDKKYVPYLTNQI